MSSTNVKTTALKSISATLYMKSCLMDLLKLWENYLNESFSSDITKTIDKAKKEPFKEGIETPKAVQESET